MTQACSARRWSRLGHVLHEPLDEDAHNLRLGVEARPGHPVAAGQHVGRERQRQRVAPCEGQRLVVMLSGDTASIQEHPPLVRAEVANRVDACQCGPLDVGPPGRLRIVASRDDDEASCGKLREQRVPKPLVEWRQDLVRVDEQDAASRPPREHRAQIAAFGVERLTERDEEPQGRGFDVAAVDAHDPCGPPRGPGARILEQRRLSDAACSGDVQRHEGRLASLEGRPEDLHLLVASDKTLAARGRESIGNPCAARTRVTRSKLVEDGNRRDEPVASLGNRLDVLRDTLVVAERPPQVRDRAGQGRLGDEPALPHRVDDLVLRGDPASAAGQEDQQVHDLWFETPCCLPVADQVPGGLSDPPADLEVRSGGWTRLLAGHRRIVDDSHRSERAARTSRGEAAIRLWHGPCCGGGATSHWSRLFMALFPESMKVAPDIPWVCARNGG